MAIAIASGLGLSLTINWLKVVETSKEIHSNPQKSKDYIEALHFLIINRGHILRAKVGNEVSLNAHDVICLDFITQARVHLFAHLSDCKSRHI